MRGGMEREVGTEGGKGDSAAASSESAAGVVPDDGVRGWTSIATRLLSGRQQRQQKCGGGGGRGITTKLSSDAWSVIDDAIPPAAVKNGAAAGAGDPARDFVADLNDELGSTGLVAKLRPARTEGEARVDDVLGLLLANPITRGLVRESLLVGGGQHDAAAAAAAPASRSNRAAARGDRSLFIGRETTRNRPEFEARYPRLSELTRRIEKSVVEHVRTIRFDTSLTSIQLAEYPGDGHSGYPRHCDRDGNACREEGKRQHAVASPPDGTVAMARMVTAVYYLTPDDWDVDEDGGCLRMFSGSYGSGGHVDVAPYRNRIVVFRSDRVEHQVLPSRRRPRRAVTVWLYGRPAAAADGDGDTKKKNHVPSGPAAVSVDDDSASDAGGTPHLLSRDPLLSKGPPPLQVDDVDGNRRNKTIFVNIASYRDSETGPTLRSLMETALDPDRVFVGLFLQVDTSAGGRYDRDEVLGQLPENEPWYASRVRCATMDARHSTGPCFARALCQSLYRGEDYVLQVDSHMRFRRNWDAYLIDQLGICESTGSSNKSMLSTYPVGYLLPDDVPNECRGTVLEPWKFGEDGMLRQRGRFFSNQPSKPVLCRLFAGGFNFSRGEVIKDVPYDGSLHHLFFGEEASMALRLYVESYDLYAPAESVCYHLWSRSHRPTPLVAPWVDREAVRRRREISMAIVQEQLVNSSTSHGDEHRANEAHKGRTASGFASAIGVDFRARRVLERHDDKEVTADALLFQQHDDKE